MRRTWDPTVLAVVLAVVMLVGAVSATGGLGPGEWRAKRYAGGASIRLDLRPPVNQGQVRIAMDLATSELEGFDAATFDRRGAPLHFRWKRDAGTLVFEGEGGRGPRGSFRLDPDPRFVEAWRALGATDPDPADLIHMATAGVRLGDLERLLALGYRDVAASTMVRLAHEPGSMQWIEELHALGVQSRIDEVLRLRAHGVRPDDVRAFKDAGVGAGIEDIIRLRNRGIEASYVKGMIAAGIVAEDLEGILRLHAHGVSVEYTTSIRGSGLPEAAVEEIIRLRNHGVEPNYVRGLIESRLPDPSIEDIVRLHAHGVHTDYVQAAVETGGGERDVEDVIRLHNHGVPTDFMQSFSRKVGAPPSTERTIRAWIQGAGSVEEPETAEAGR
jgi:hypothetical protein